MRHGVDGRKFGRNTSHRKAMFRNLANAVISKEQVTTTVAKAKETKRVVDRLITLGKTGLDSKRRLAFDRTRDNAVVKKLFDVLGKRYQDRAGGYTRVLKVSDRRWGDAAEMAILELVDHPMLDRRRKPNIKKASADAHAHEHDGHVHSDADGEHVHKHSHSHKPQDLSKAKLNELAQSMDPFKRFRKLFKPKAKAQVAKDSE